MANLRDSVIDQYGNAIPSATVLLFDYASGTQLGSKTTDINGFFEFSNLTWGQYKLQISGPNLTTRIIGPIQVLDPYPNATTLAAGLMSAADKTKLDGLPATPTLALLGDVALTSLADGD